MLRRFFIRPWVYSIDPPYVKVLTPNQKGAGSHNGPVVGLFQPSFCVLRALQPFDRTRTKSRANLASRKCEACSEPAPPKNLFVFAAKLCENFRAIFGGVEVLPAAF